MSKITKAIDAMTTSEIRNIAYSTCMLCESSEVCEGKTVRQCKEIMRKNSMVKSV